MDSYCLPFALQEGLKYFSVAAAAAAGMQRLMAWPCFELVFGLAVFAEVAGA